MIYFIEYMRLLYHLMMNQIVYFQIVILEFIVNVDIEFGRFFLLSVVYSI